MSLILNALQRKQAPVARNVLGGMSPKPSQPSAPVSRFWNGFYVLISLLVLAALAAFIISLARQDILGSPVASASAQSSVSRASSVDAATPSTLPASNPSPLNTAPASPPAVHEATLVAQQDRDAQLAALTAQLKQRDTMISDLLRMEQARQANSFEEFATASVASALPQQEAAVTIQTQPSPGEFHVHSQTPTETAQEAQERTHRQRIASRVAEFEIAVDNRDLADAQRKLDQLAALLPPDSLTLLRNRAWLALNNDQDAIARGLYQRILDRMPDDTQANINLAVLDARTGARTAAIQRLQRLISSYPDKQEIWIALEQLQGASP